MPESIDTKNTIASCFRELMEKKAFEKITISDITAACGLNRQTFYYHFQDKYDLLNWIFYNEAIAPFTEELSFDNWSAKLLTMLETIRSNSRFYQNALSTAYGDEFRNYMLDASTRVFSEVIDDIAGQKVIPADDKRFIAEFFSFGIVGCVIKWIQSGMRVSPDTMSAHIENLVNDCKRLAVTRYFSE